MNEIVGVLLIYLFGMILAGCYLVGLYAFAFWGLHWATPRVAAAIPIVTDPVFQTVAPVLFAIGAFIPLMARNHDYAPQLREFRHCIDIISGQINEVRDAIYSRR